MLRASSPVRMTGATEDLERARFGLDRRLPAMSARTILRGSQVIALALIGYAIWSGLRYAPGAVFDGAHALAFLLFASFVILRLFAAAAAMMPTDNAETRWEGPLPVYTILCPLYREAPSVPALVAALLRLDYAGIMAQTPPPLRCGSASNFLH